MKNLKSNKFLLYFILTILLFMAERTTICLAQAICSKCGETIRETYWELNGNILCNKCYEETALRCSKCNEILDGKYRILDGKNYCSSCYEKIALRCSICNEILEGKYVTSMDGKKNFCERCKSAYPPCCNCYSPAGPSGVRLPDGRSMCFDCYTTAIFEQEEIDKVFEQVKKEMERVLGMKVNYPVKKINLVDKKRLNEIYNNQDVEYAPEDGVSGIHYYEKINNRLTLSEIYVLNGLTPTRALDVLSHEYAHAWQAENCPDNQNLKDREGFAEWVAYKILKAGGHETEASIKLQTDDPIYGKGLKEMLELEKEKRAKGVLEYAVTTSGGNKDNLSSGKMKILVKKEKLFTSIPSSDKLKVGLFLLTGIFVLTIIFLIYKKHKSC